MTQRTTTVPERLQELAATHPDRPFVVEADGRTATYAEFHAESLVWAAAYRSLGLGPGDNVVTMVRPSVTAYASWLGMCWLKVVDVGCNTDYQGQMLAYLLNQSRSRVAVVDAQYLPRLVAVAADVPGIEAVVVLGDDTGEGSAGAPFRVVSSDDLLADVEPVGDLEPPNVWDTAMMTY